MERASETVTAPESKPSVPVPKLAGWWSSGIQFLRDTRSELRNVVWPTREEVYDTTLVVIGIAVFFGFFLWGVDVVVTRLLEMIFKWLA
ncbi:preprotein translocase subunit SecE [Chloracidobacterium aggregatum]|jgi:preprotein translocase subunit SecE|uniref:Protein translocase subunit SecE n=1 Tax=Chloracidobacterium sp. N TaxID=2821540 RepID=A0ABX8B3L3_9BACT|nr:preprotein translocase subunit SecE [Chloracidobacterium aggregatum]QUV85620.1 preprotein translocase subunit SecE [Chloracidobacterium sp. 2]QUV87976.1 preprotein translocase subunit SecE [Chloracidobacterium sp. S]QUV90896.1 preprotein translocase subunit SecE [Chloracidobacterium sp. A]QUV94086.1 preprotein translocase subunit SecE [Chloracidobacterium sp. N]QUV97283.1 preprotein translocase subunit SecE [Chloracidobacterium sp. E]